MQVLYAFIILSIFIYNKLCRIPIPPSVADPDRFRVRFIAGLLIGGASPYDVAEMLGETVEHYTSETTQAGLIEPPLGAPLHSAASVMRRQKIRHFTAQMRYSGVTIAGVRNLK